MLCQGGFRNNHYQHSAGLQSTEGTCEEKFFKPFGSLIRQIVFGGKAVRRIQKQEADCRTLHGAVFYIGFDDTGQSAHCLLGTVFLQFNPVSLTTYFSDCKVEAKEARASPVPQQGSNMCNKPPADAGISRQAAIRDNVVLVGGEVSVVTVVMRDTGCIRWF